MGELTNYYAP